MNVPANKASRDWGIIKKRQRDGTEHWYARIIRFDGAGKKKQYTAKADNKSHARRLRDQLQQKFDDRGEMAIDGDRMKFAGLADVYEKRKLFAAEYHGTGKSRRKVAGVRSLRPSQHYLSVLRDHFGGTLLKKLTHAEIENFKGKRLKERSIRGERSITDVNRTLELLRAILRFAVQNGWLTKSPFEMGSPLISKADETRRERVLSFEEERRLLNACDSERVISYKRAGKSMTAKRNGGREYLRALIVVALDTAMRKGELLKLQWKDVDLISGVLTVQALNSKTSRERTIGMTQRVFDEVKALWDRSHKDQDLLVFGIKDNFQHGFTNLLAESRIDDLRFHDLRHSAITRMVNAGLPPVEIMKVSGHTQWTTFARYVNPTSQTVRNIADTLTQYVSAAQTETVREMIN